MKRPDLFSLLDRELDQNKNYNAKDVQHHLKLRKILADLKSIEAYLEYRDWKGFGDNS